MNGLSIVIPSKTLNNLKAGIRSIRECGETCRIIVVDDSERSLADQSEIERHYNFEEAWQGIAVVSGVKPFVFSRNVNIGILAAGEDDVIVLNDDALLKTDRGFSVLQRAASEHAEFGIIASTTNCAGNENQFPRGQGLREDLRMVCFVAVLIPRRTIDRIGLLDERFTGYGMDDDDYSLRVREAALKIGIHDGCYVDHMSLPSSYRGVGGSGNYLPNLEIFKQKWGVDNWGRPA